MGRRNANGSALPEDPLWYKDAILYELHVRAFRDSDGDGIGDFRGLIERLDYLQDLGVTALWLLPFYPSPLRDDGYDVADYTDVHANYGTLSDCKLLLREAHKRGLRVITELVLNHTSDRHPWFRRAQRAQPGSAWRDFYVWSDSPEKYQEARIIFQDFESSNWAWDPVAHAYYWHRFYAHQPELNYTNPHVRQAILRVIDFWCRLGVDGLRLDAVPYLCEQEGTICENLPETHAFLKELRRHLDGKFPNRMLLAEANQWPEDAAAYFGQGDECHMAFHFPVMPRLFMAVQTEDRFPLIDILQQTPDIPDSCQWGMFLRNHDELTLEMVADEERDYMYRAFAQDPQGRINLGIRRRLAPLLGNHRRRIELLNALLFSLPGTPVLYYGDEIGMGDNVYLGDRNGVRTPMQWNADQNAGFSQANPQQLYLPVIVDPEYHYEALNVEIQQKNRHSLLWWMKRLIALRKQFKAFGRGTVEVLHPENRTILAFLRRYQEECVLVVANLSRFTQWTELDLSPFTGAVPIEIFGGLEFPPIREQPYPLALAPHTFYWFTLEPRRKTLAVRTSLQTRPPILTRSGPWETLFQSDTKRALEALLPDYLLTCRWFGGKTRPLRAVELTEVIPLADATPHTFLVLLTVTYTEGEAEIYLIPLRCATGKQADRVRKQRPQTVIACVRGAGAQGWLYEARWDTDVYTVLLDAIARRRSFRGRAGRLLAKPTRVFSKRGTAAAALVPSLLQVEQSTTIVTYGKAFLLKLFWQVQAGAHPDIEIRSFLTEKAHFPHAPAVAGTLEYHPKQGAPLHLAMLQPCVPNQGSAWDYTLSVLVHYFEAAQSVQEATPPLSKKSWFTLQREDLPSVVRELIGSYGEFARLLGQRTAELHMALASDTTDPDFLPEPFSVLHQRSRYQFLRILSTQVFQLLRQCLKSVPEAVRSEAGRVLHLEDEVGQRLHSVLNRKVSTVRLRCHGSYHLGQLLYTKNDVVIVGFGGEPLRPLSERRLKHPPMKDVAGMLRSFHYAAYAGLFHHSTQDKHMDRHRIAALEPWAQWWWQGVSTVFLHSYLTTASGAVFLPLTGEERQVLLDIYLLERVFYELGYELHNRPDWVRIPLQGIRHLVGAGRA